MEQEAHRLGRGKYAHIEGDTILGLPVPGGAIWSSEQMVDGWWKATLSKSRGSI
jgi:hypothetical protein